LEALFPKDRIEKVFEDLEIGHKTRAEDLTLENWKKLTASLN
jgi:16S rRNA A1518/A1519 N6-dimethyltransferase RsmA/KsgA/DIM1 with predicted DNA glycosylase/AP lyase activity